MALPGRARLRGGWVDFLSVALVLFLLGWRYQLVIVDGGSMRPTMESGDLLVVNRSAYSAGGPKEGDIVVAWVSGERVVKRIVGLPGMMIEVRDGAVVIDGTPRQSGHDVSPGSLNIKPGMIGPGRFAILGDNRIQRTDQTAHALVMRSQIIGKVVGRMACGEWVRGWFPGLVENVPTPNDQANPGTGGG